jgi:hypothetical protein
MPSRSGVLDRSSLKTHRPNAAAVACFHWLDRGFPPGRGLGHWRSSPHIPVSRTKLAPGDSTDAGLRASFE